MVQRIEFVHRALTEVIPFSEFCKEYNISRKTSYKSWKKIIGLMSGLMNCNLMRFTLFRKDIVLPMSWTSTWAITPVLTMAILQK